MNRPFSCASSCSKYDSNLVDHPINGASILITGGTGSFGSHFARYILTHYKPERVIIFSRDELKQWNMQQQDPLFSAPNVRFFLGDVRDKERLKLAFRDVQFVIHTAALKQVPAAEYNPTEFVQTNVLGAMNITTAAIEAGVEKVIALSTDKAVNPINLYGATKLCSDKLFLAANAYSGKKGTPVFSSIRYGNVMASRGSLLPFWSSLADKGASSLPITNMDMTRFWITLDEAVSFVTMALYHQVGAEVFVPKSPSVRIKDLAEALYPNMKLEVSGIRPGEKIHEILISSDEARSTYEFQDHFRIMPAFSVHKPERTQAAIKKALNKVSEDFILSSNHNPLFLSSLDDIRALVRKGMKENDKKV